MRGIGGAMQNRKNANSRLAPILDGAPVTLSGICGSCGLRVSPLGTERFGQTGILADLYRHHRLEGGAIIYATAELLIARQT
jgi:pyruvate dehydrogenase E1 component